MHSTKYQRTPFQEIVLQTENLEWPKLIARNKNPIFCTYFSCQILLSLLPTCGESHYAYVFSDVFDLSTYCNKNSGVRNFSESFGK